MIHINPELSYSTVPHRALRICHAILAHRSEMTPAGNGYAKLEVGKYTIMHAPPETYLNGPAHNVNIWERGKKKLANVEWVDVEGAALVGVVSFRSGDWEGELVGLLTAPATIN